MNQASGEKRKGKQIYPTPEGWQEVKEAIHGLYIGHNLPLKTVRLELAQRGFIAS